MRSTKEKFLKFATLVLASSNADIPKAFGDQRGSATFQGTLTTGDGMAWREKFLYTRNTRAVDALAQYMTEEVLHGPRDNGGSINWAIFWENEEIKNNLKDTHNEFSEIKAGYAHSINFSCCMF